jgi:hypothetical protein
MKHDSKIHIDRQERLIGMTADHTCRPDKVLFFPTAHFLFFNFIAYTHCTHLLLPAYAQTNPKSKAKECNLQRFKNSVNFEKYY